jgi:hypothetical protein
VLISTAHAQQAAAATDPTGGLMQLLPIILMFVVLYFLMVRPQTSSLVAQPKGNSRTPLTASIHESLSALEIRHRRPRTGLRPDLHACPTSSASHRPCRSPAPRRRSRSMTRTRERVANALQSAAIERQRHLPRQQRRQGSAAQRPTSQLQAKDVLEKAIQSGCRVTRSTSSRSTCCRVRRSWLTSLRALPMYLGLDLRGGVHFLLQVDMKGARDQAARCPRRRPAQPAARQEHPPCRHLAARASVMVDSLP